ncbi:hypothetical protein WCX18_06950 [Sulfurimonas sp. HSL1-2]|uniref:hypothetical protein n=1 Tax=Thiomicrolovo zhangzhouensis TaxID=3131933 RepID=UPI0031F769BA
MILESLGLTSYDIALLVGCPIGAVIGSLAQAIVKSIDLEGPPTNEDDMKIASKELQELRGTWLYLRMVLGGILGIVLGLYFIGSIQPSAATVAKIIALSIIAGYAAPKVWEAQERIVEAKLKKIADREEANDSAAERENSI